MAIESGIQSRPGRQAFHVAATLHGQAANPVATGHGIGKAVILQQGADHADGETIASTHGVNDLAYRHSGDKPLILSRAVIRAVSSQFDHHGFDAKILRKIVAIRKQDADKRDEEQQLIATYMAALGMLADTPLGQAAIARGGRT